MTKAIPSNIVALIGIAMTLGTLVAPWPDSVLPVRLLGLAMLVAGVVLGAYHARMFRRVGTTIATFDDPETLVRNSGYVWTRNPMYLGTVVFLFGIALALGSLVALAAPVIFFVVADRWYIPFEERRLAATFGADYEQYRRQVRRWVGRRSPSMQDLAHDTSMAR